MLSQIQIVGASGYINDVNMAYPGAAVWSGPGGTGLTQTFAGQLGQELELPSELIRYNSANGTVFGGLFRLVQFKQVTGTPVVGQMLYWYETGSDQNYIVTDDYDQLTYVSTNFAGVVLTPNLTDGHYTYIQTYGIVYAKFVPTVTGTKATGRPVSVSIVTEGLFDIIDTDTPQQNVGYAIDLPADGGLTRINMRRMNPRG